MLKSDLIVEELAVDSGIETKSKYESIDVSKIVLDEANSKKYHKDAGIYYTLTTDCFVNINKKKYDDLVKAFSNIIKEFLSMYNVKKEDPVFVVGLGNSDVTPDSLGPKVIDMLLVTSHLKRMNKLEKNMQNVLALAPGVMSQTGLETVDIVSNISKSIKPKLVIVIDALASKSLNRLNKTIQLNNTSIAPGAGIGNYRKKFDKNTLGTNIVAIGVPTVVDIRSVLHEALNSFTKGLPDTLPFSFEDETIQFMVTPKEIDQNIIDISSVIADGLNLAFHNNFQ